MNNLRGKFNRSVAETIADIKCNSNIDGNTSPEYLEREREDVMRTLTNPIKLSNVVDTAKNMPSDIAKGIGSIIKMPISIAHSLIDAGNNVRERDVNGCVKELAKGVRNLVTDQLAPVRNIGNRFASSVRDNQ